MASVMMMMMMMQSHLANSYDDLIRAKHRSRGLLMGTKYCRSKVEKWI